MALEPTVLIPEKSLLPTNHTPDSSPFTSLTTARGPRGPFKTQEVGIIIPFAKEKTEAQRGAVGCPGSHFQERQGSLLVPALAPVGKASMTSHDKPSAVDSVCVCVFAFPLLSHMHKPASAERHRSRAAHPRLPSSAHPASGQGRCSAVQGG